MLTRFAPAPTGYLHLGHVVNAICVWGLARAHHGRVLLRIEDHDRQRSRVEYERALLDDLDWLGFEADVFPTSSFRAGVCESRQSDREAIYRSIAGELIDRGLVYACACSRQEIAADAAVDATGGERRYPGTCRDRALPLDSEASWRVRMEPGVETFDDLWCGPQTQTPADQCGDMVIRDRLRQWTYQFAVAVDDHLQGIDFVIRGRDLLDSTGRQIRLARLIGRRDPPRFAHHPLIMKPHDAGARPAQKLSKADGATGVRELRRAGVAAASVIGDAAHRLGLLREGGPLSATEAGSLLGDYLASRTTFSNPTPVQR